MIVADSLQNQAVNATGLANQTSEGLASDFDTFLQLLTAQIRNQDPLNPSDSTEFVAQLATFSNVEQSVQTNDLLGGISGQLSTQSMGQLASWVGMDARASMPIQFRGDPETLYVGIPSIADNAELVVQDENGVEVQRIKIDPTSKEITWDGTSPGQPDVEEGIYQFHVESFAGDQSLSKIPAEVFKEVQEATMSNGEIYLVFDGDIAVSSSMVQGLRTPLT